LVGHGQQWLSSEQARVQEDLRARRQRSGMVDAGFLVQELDARVGGGILAGALAFRIFLYMVPFVYVVFTVLGAVARALGQDPAHLAKNVGITGILASTVVKVEDQSAWTQAALILGALSFALWWWVSWKLPHAPVPPRALVPGALLMAAGADVLQLLTTYWIGYLVARKTNTYGAVGVALAVLLWVYILGRIMVGSAGLNAALWYRRESRAVSDP
jgi:uncharacterized BrkB/YihY/UPF0761 family membrane protein